MPQARRERHAALSGSLIERLPTDIENLHGFGQALQFQRTDPLEEERVAPSAHHPDGLRGQDLAGVGVGAEPGRLYHRVAVVVVRLERRLSAAESYAQSQLMAGADVVTVDGLLHRHGARQGGGRAAEHGHHPVAEALHLSPSGAGDGSTQQREVSLEQLVRRLRADCVTDLGRADQVGEQHRDGLGDRQDSPPPVPPCRARVDGSQPEMRRGGEPVWAIVTPGEPVTGARSSHAQTFRAGWAFDPGASGDGPMSMSDARLWSDRARQEVHRRDPTPSRPPPRCCVQCVG